MSTRYAKLQNGQPRYAGEVIPTATGFIVRPTEAQLRANGWLPVRDEPPTTDESHYARPTGWAIVEDAIRRQYEVVEIPPPPPRVFSKLKVVAALKAANVWDAVKQYIIDADLYDLYLAAQEFAEDNQYFTQGKAALQTALSWTDEQVEAVLAASVKDGY